MEVRSDTGLCAAESFRNACVVDVLVVAENDGCALRPAQCDEGSKEGVPVIDLPSRIVSLGWGTVPYQEPALYFRRSVRRPVLIENRPADIGQRSLDTLDSPDAQSSQHGLDEIFAPTRVPSCQQVCEVHQALSMDVQEVGQRQPGGSLQLSHTLNTLQRRSVLHLKAPISVVLTHRQDITLAQSACVDAAGVNRLAHRQPLVVCLADVAETI